MDKNHIAEVTQEEVARYIDSGQRLFILHPEANEKLKELATRGFDMHPVVSATVVKRCRPDVAVWLGTKEGEEDARRLLNVAHNERRSLEELDKIAARLDRNKPFADHESPISETDRYLRERREAIRKGTRRR